MTTREDFQDGWGGFSCYWSSSFNTGGGSSSDVWGGGDGSGNLLSVVEVPLGLYCDWDEVVE